MPPDEEKGQPAHVYMAVTADRYELPLAVAETARELGNVLGVSKKCVYNRVHNGKRAEIKRPGRCTGVNVIKVELEDSTNDDEF